jgi:hypothetical protein
MPDWIAAVGAAAATLDRELRAGHVVAGAVIPTPAGTITVRASYTRGRAARPAKGIRLRLTYRVGETLMDLTRWLPPGAGLEDMRGAIGNLADRARGQMAVAALAVAP